MPSADPVVIRSLQRQFARTETTDRFLTLLTEIARKTQLLVDSVHVASFEQQVCCVALEFVPLPSLLEAHRGQCSIARLEARHDQGVVRHASHSKHNV